MKQSQKEIDNNISKLNNSSKNKIALAKAEGANSEQIFQLEKARLEEQIRYTKLMYDSGVKLTGEQYKQQKQAKFDLKILEAQHNTDLLNAQKDLNTKKTEENKASRKKNKEDKKAQDLEDFNIEQERLRNLKNLENQYLTEKEQSENDYYNSKLTAEQLEVQNTQDKYFSLIEQAKIYGQDSAILEQAQKDELAAINNKYRDEDKKEQDVIDKKKLDDDKALQDKKIQMTLTGLSILQDATSLFTAKNEKDARRQFKISKALSLSTAIINTGLAVTAALTAGGNPIKLATGMQFVEAGVAAASGAINIAKISATQFGGFGGGGADKPTTPSDKGMNGGGVITPNFNIVGNNGTNQLKQLQQAPIQAYVVSGEMSTQQSLDRNRLRNATL
jgi:hypothetical protein